MIICRKCGYKSMAGSIYCERCGTRLSSLDEDSTQQFEVETSDMDFTRNPMNGTRQPAPGKLDTWGTLHLLDTGQMLPLSDRNEFTLGRTSDGQPIMPDIDLSPYHGYASGVSRLHAVIKRSGERVTVMDLGSSNGTYLNGKRMTANIEQVVNHGDVISLGKLKIQVLIRS
jgi:hypothetical protein